MTPRSKAFTRRCSGFTLVEVLMALSIFVLLALSAYETLRAGLLRMDRWSRDASTEGEQRVAMALLARDIRSAYLASEELQTYFVGAPADGLQSNRMDFTRRATGAGAEQDAVWRVSYFLEPGAEPGIWNLCRRCQSTTTPILSGVKSFDLEYFDGRRWSVDWNWDSERKEPMKGIRGLPLFVRVSFSRARSTDIESQQWTVPVMTAVINRATHA